MLVFDNTTNKYVVDPHYLNIIYFRRILDTDTTHKKEIGNAKLLWIYHMYNPHSPFRDHRNKDKSQAIVEATFPKWFIEQQEKSLQAVIDDAILKNQELDIISDTIVEGGEVKPKKKVEYFVPALRIYDPLEDKVIKEAAEWYINHLQSTPLWQAYNAYKEAMYNLSKIISDPEATAQSIRAASTELDTIPLKMEKMRQQAIKDEAMTLKITGEKNIKRSEKIESHSTRRKRNAAKEKAE